jgi:GNAT superfamily N-acetyltransferase
VFIGELVVRVDHQRRGIGSALLRAVEERYAGIPVHVKPFDDAVAFFTRNGYRRAGRPMSVLLKRNALATA